MRSAVTFIIFVFSAAAAASEPVAPVARLENVARRLVAAINKHDYRAARRDFNEGMLEALSEEKAKAFFDGLLEQFGTIEKLGPARLNPPNQAVIPAFFERGTLDIRLVLDGEDKIAGLWFLPRPANIPVPEKNSTPLSLPCRGRWLIQWGGDTKEVNQHHEVPNQRFAFDLLGVGEDGRTRKGDGTRNEDYYAFEREVLAPADGVVTDVITGVRDNVPGSMNPYSALGNAVFIQHSAYEVSVIAHLKFGSVTVKPGQKVRRGELVGLCGNSGNSSEPHIHYHLMNTPIVQDAIGIKVFFDRLVVERGGEKKPAENCSPVKGDIISSF